MQSLRCPSFPHGCPQPQPLHRQPLACQKKVLSTFLKLLTTFPQQWLRCQQRGHRYRPKQLVLVYNNTFVVDNDSVVADNGASASHQFMFLTRLFPLSIFHSRLGERAELERASRSGVKGEGFFSFSFFRFEDAALPPKK